MRVVFKKKVKLINHLFKNGNKKTCETVLLKSFKNMQKNSLKSYKKIFKISIINSASIFRIIKLKQKKRKIAKEIPVFIFNNSERISWALKAIVISSKKQNSNNFYEILKQEITINSKNKGNSITKKTDSHKLILQKKRLLLYFKW